MGWNGIWNRPDSFVRFLISCERLMFLLLAFTVWTAVIAGSDGHGYLLAALSVLPATLLTGWVWLRLMKTHMEFISTVHDLREREKAWQ